MWSPNPREPTRWERRRWVDTVLGWRLVNPRMQELYPPIGLGETAEEVAAKYGVTRTDQDEFALTSHQRAVAAQKEGPVRRRDRPHRGSRWSQETHHRPDHR